MAQTLPLPYVSTACVAKTVPFLAAPPLQVTEEKNVAQKIPYNQVIMWSATGTVRHCLSVVCSTTA